ncbi:MAG: YbaN family protein [Neomegalonema sp.]|nr:YbaN family protein [Neomegalonema sp.]
MAVSMSEAMRPGGSSQPREWRLPQSVAREGETGAGEEPAAAPRRSTPPGKLPTSRFRWLWLAAGWVLFGIGFVGIFLPVLPTTGFWILAVIAFERSNPAIAARIRRSPRFGPSVSAFLDHGVITRRGKVAALTGMLISVLPLALLVEGAALWLALGGVAIGAVYVTTRRSRPKAPRPSASDER